MNDILQPPAAPVEGEFDAIWSDPEALADLCIAAMEQVLGRDGARLAALLGISHRELNKFRERDDDGRLKKGSLPLLLLLLHFASMKFGPGRTVLATQLVQRAAGHAPSAAAARGESGPALAVMSRALRECCDAAAKFAARAEDGLDRADARALIPEVMEGMQNLQTTLELLERRAAQEDESPGPRRTRA